MLKAPAFWWRPRAGLAARLLQPVAGIWAKKASERMVEPPCLRAPVPVFCVGNFVVGGAGKTPTALALADLVRLFGGSPGFLTRGYGGSVTGAHRVDRTKDSAALVGDEPLLLAEKGPVVVSADRPAGVPLLLAAGVDAIIMDDGFQNPSLAKDFSLLVVDGRAGIGNGRVVPSGPLRAPLALQLERAQAVLIIGAGRAGDAVARDAAMVGLPVVRGRLVPTARSGLKGKRVLAFAGIGRPEKFFASLDEAGAERVASEVFADHHPYTEAAAERLMTRAARDGLTLVTTGKDRARLQGASGARARLAEVTEVLKVRLVFDDEARLAAMIGAVLRAPRQL